MNAFGQWPGILARLVLLSTCLAGAAAHAETNVLTNPVLAPGNGAGTLPATWSQQGWTTDSAGAQHQIGPCPDTYLCAAYAYGVDSADNQPYLEVTFTSHAADVSYTNLFFDNARAAGLGDNYRIAIAARLTPDSSRTYGIGLGFHLYDTGYISEAAADFSGQLPPGGSDQAIAYSFQPVANYAGTGRTPTSVQPRLAIAIPPQAMVHLRIKSPLLTHGMRLSSVGIDARTGRPQLITAAPGKVLRFTAGLQGRPATPAQSVVTLVPVGLTLIQPLASVKPPIALQPLQPLSHDLVPTHPNVGDVWQVPLPSDARPGTTYSIRYAVRDTATGALLPLQPDADVATYGSGGSTTSLEIGQVAVQTGGGMAIGQHFHGHPGSYGGDPRGTDPILVTYDFVRSHDSQNVGGTSWWVEDTVTHNPDGLYDWTEFDHWANFHTSAGRKKLLVTFFGTPTWASSKPTAGSPYGIPGLTAPPANLASYGRMVKATVTRYADRIYATECWNEPGTDPNGFFNGTGTQLADICKAIYTNTKAVNPAIPVICPAADLPWVLTQKTSQGEPLSQFCDWANAHPYNATGTDLNGEDYSVDRLGDFVDAMKLQLTQLGLNKPIALTEWGMSCDDRPAPAHPAHFHDADAATRGDLLYQMLAKAKEKGVVALGLYSYDSGASQSFSTGAQCPFGWEGIGNLVNGGYSYDATTAASVTKAVQDFGTPLP